MLLFHLNLPAFLCGCTCLNIVHNCAVYMIWKANQPKYEVSMGVVFRGFDTFITNIHFTPEAVSPEPVIFFLFSYNSFEDSSFAVESSVIFATQLCSFSCRIAIKVNFLEGFIKRTISVDTHRKHMNKEETHFIEIIHSYLQSRCGVRILLQWN